MLSLVVLFTVFLGLVGVLIFLNELQNKWSRTNTLAPQLLREKVEQWLEAQQLHAPTPSELLPVLNQRLTEWLQAEEREFKELFIEELLTGTQLPEFKITKIVSQTPTSLKLECDVEWPMCVPGVAVKVVPQDSSSSITCHLQVEWMYAHALVTMTKGEGGVLLLSYAHTSPPMMGVSCGVENQSLDDQKSAKLASSVTDNLQEMFTKLSLKQVPMVVPLPTPLPVAPLPVAPLPVVLVSAPEEVSSDAMCTSIGKTYDASEKSEPCEDSGAGDGGDSVSGVGSDDVAEGDLIVEDHKSEVASTPLVNHTLAAACEDGSKVSKADVVGEESEAGATNDEHEDRRDDSTTQSEPSASPPSSTHVTPILLSDTKELLEAADEPRPISPQWRRSSSYEQLTNSLQSASPHSYMSTPERKALTMSMAGSEAESLYGADDRIPSTLVFEVRDSLRVRHIVALSGAHASKLRRNFPDAQKLHIYNDHCFLATHIKDKCLCFVCKSKISGIFGKQAYTCRDCGLVVHKQCHFKTESLCSKSQVRTLNLIYPTTISTVVG